MTNITDPLRREAEALVESCLTDFDHIGKPHIVDAVVAFAKAQRAAEVRTMKEAFRTFTFPRPYKQSAILNWLDQRQKEWET